LRLRGFLRLWGCLVRQDSLCQGSDISAVYESAKGKAGHKDRGGRGETFNHIFSLIYGVIDLSEGESRYRFFKALVSTINSAWLAERKRGNATRIVAAAGNSAMAISEGKEPLRSQMPPFRQVDAFSLRFMM
jgi:hypothetical protein